MAFKLFSLIMALLILSMPCITLAQQTSDSAQALVDAQTDAKEPFGWLAGSFLMASACGLLGGGIAVLASQAMTPSPPASRFIGKSAEYVSFYTNTYQSEVKRKRLIYTSGGCLAGTVVAVIIWAPVYASY